jgi:squalene-hopene/tetraprenyl-beta-curcumene cyclase
MIDMRIQLGHPAGSRSTTMKLTRPHPAPALALCFAWVVVAGAAHAGEPGRGVGSDDPPTPVQPRDAIVRGLAFLEADAANWRSERGCATCHHGTMTTWALVEAKGQGYPVDEPTLSDLAAWTKERLASIDKPRDTQPGSNMVNTPALYLALMAQAVPAQEAVTPDELERIAGHLLRHQEEDGSWAWSLAPAANRPPPVFESDEVATLMAYIALRPRRPADADEASPAREARQKALAWLGRTRAAESTQATALRLFRDVREGKPPQEVESGIERLLGLQNDDGGWGQEAGLPSDAYATGQALYFLSLAGVPRERDEVVRGVGFLASRQREDGAWPMTSRAQPGASPMTNPVPITYFGSSWAVLGLVRSVPR